MIKNDRGVVSVFVAIMFVAILAVVGLINDGASVRNNRRKLADLVAQVVRVAAQEIDQEQLRTTGEVVLDIQKAKQVALDTLATHNIQGEVDVVADQVRVVAQQRVELWAGRSLEITAQRTARVTTNFSSSQDSVP